MKYRGRDKDARDKDLREHWGGLPARVVTAVKKAWGCRSLGELRRNFPSPTEEDLFMAKGIGSITLEALRGVMPIKASESISGWKSEPMYLTRTNHLRGTLWNSLPSRHAWEITQFFHALIAAARGLPLDEKRHSRVPCMAGPRRKWCLGIIEVSRTGNPPEMQWNCPECGKSGVIRGAGNL